jgi:ribosome-associated protein
MREEWDNDQSLSRTKKKQQAKEIERLAHQLTELPESQFSQLQMSAEVCEEVELARATRGRGSHKRQVKHLAGLLRKLDDELAQLQDQLQSLDQVAGSEKRAFHQLEKLRDRLCDKGSFDEAFAEMLTRYPQIDRKAISRLARSVHQHADKRASREIFKRLRDYQEEE